MRKTREFQVKKEVLIKIGERVFIDDVEWKAAEVIDDIVTLYREGIGGESHTIQKTVNEVKTLVFEKA
jgi:hypothetical protein|tara:strand:+ start:368 stop:571 length:204 start_codon:yes stop_codon:yes gene_type:complete